MFSEPAKIFCDLLLLANVPFQVIFSFLEFMLTYCGGAIWCRLTCQLLSPRDRGNLPPALRPPHNTHHFRVGLKTATLLGQIIIINKCNQLPNSNCQLYIWIFPRLILLIHPYPIWRASVCFSIRSGFGIRCFLERQKT